MATVSRSAAHRAIYPSSERSPSASQAPPVPGPARYACILRKFCLPTLSLRKLQPAQHLRPNLRRRAYASYAFYAGPAPCPHSRLLVPDARLLAPDSRATVARGQEPAAGSQDPGAGSEDAALVLHKMHNLHTPGDANSGASAEPAGVYVAKASADKIFAECMHTPPALPLEEPLIPRAATNDPFAESAH